MRKLLTCLIVSLWFAYVPAHANMMMTGVGGPPLVPCTPSTQASTFLARTSGLNATETNAYCNLINGLVADGIWTSFDAIYVLATNTTTTAALNLVSTSFSLLTVGSPTFTADRGYTGAASAALNTQFDTTVGGRNYTQNSASLWAWTLTNFSSGGDYGSMLGNTSGSFNIRLYPHYSNNEYFWAVNDALVNGSTNVGHFYGTTRSNSTQATEYVDTTANLVTAASTAPAGTISLLADNNSGLNPFGGIQSFAAIGSGLNSTQQGQLYARVHTMQTIAGAP
jgi:hypothetical protein